MLLLLFPDIVIKDEIFYQIFVKVEEVALLQTWEKKLLDLFIQ